MTDANINYTDLDAIAVTQGPGLVGSLLVGIGFAKGLSLATGLPLLGISHLEGHIYSQWLAADFYRAGLPYPLADRVGRAQRTAADARARRPTSGWAAR